MTTIKDVAALAQVSIKTVSRVLNGEPHVSSLLTDRVNAAAKKLNYTPNQSARRLAGGRSFLIAFVYNNPTPSYIAAIQTGAAVRCRELGYHLLVEPMDLDSPERFGALERLSATLKPDSAFLVPPLSDDVELLRELQSLGIMTMRIAGTTEDYGVNLRTPEREGGGLVTRHLLDLGHRKIAMIAPPKTHAAALERVSGYREAMQAAGITVPAEWVCEGQFDFASGLAEARKMLARSDRPTAIIAGNDEMALGVMAAARLAGLSVPEDLSVAGFDDTPASASAWPPLTTVRQPLEAMGRLVIDHLTKAKDIAASELEFSLVVRKSTAPPPAW